MFIPKFFEIQELISPVLFKQLERKPSGWVWQTLFDERLLRVIDTIRKRFGPMQVNTWYDGGTMMYRGLRLPGCGIGAKFSQHRFGRAVDMVPLDVTVDTVRESILNYQYCSYLAIGGIELEVPWLHIDVRSRDKHGSIVEFTP